MKYFFPIIILAICFSNCANETAQGNNDVEAELAVVFCDCVQGSIDMNRALANLKRTNQANELIQKLDEASKRAKESYQCCKKALGGKDINRLNRDALYEAMKSSCPDLPERLFDDVMVQLRK